MRNAQKDVKHKQFNGHAPAIVQQTIIKGSSLLEAKRHGVTHQFYGLLIPQTPLSIFGIQEIVNPHIQMF
jgi:hypothetical protein